MSMNQIWIKLSLVMLLCALLPASCSSPGSQAGATGAAAHTGFEQEILLRDLDTPWGIAFLPDGDMLFTERPGNVYRYDGTRKVPIGRVDAAQIAESGLLGVAVDPQFQDNRRIYLYSTYEADSGLANKVTRYELRDDALSAPLIIIDGIPGAQFHDGGRIRFGPDGFLYVTTGDATVPDLAQDKDSLAGKILRMDTNGSAPADNPFGNYVYTMGHRNPQGLAWHPESGRLYATEHGPSSKDEINLITSGANYGWPATCDQPGGGFTAPVTCYTEFTLAPSGADFFEGALYVAGLRGEQLRKLELSGNGQSVQSQTALLQDLGRIREVVAHGGWLYIATNNTDGRGSPRPGDDKILRIRNP